jgi:AcrR family transcriptional regulator
MHKTLSRTRLPAAARRAAIVEAAIDLFSRKGFGGTTTRQLAAAVGVSEPVLYQHFANKRALYEAILEMKSAETPAGVDEKGDSREYFTQLGRQILDWYCDDPRYARLLMYSALEEHELSKLFYERHVGVFYEWVTRHLKKQMKRGKLKKIDPLLAARSFAGMVAHQGMVYAIYRPGELAGSREKVVRTVVDIFLEGLKK